MKIPTFEEYINERLFNKSMNRIKSGNERKEDKLTEYEIKELFDFNINDLYNFLKKHNLIEITKEDFWEEAMNVFENPIKQWVSAHGTLELGFSKDDNCKLPDFNYSFNIDDLKIKIFIEYTDNNKEFKVFAGRNKSDFDISEYRFGIYLRRIFYKIIKDTLNNEPDLMIKNLKMNFEEFKKLLADYVYDCCLSTLSYEYQHDQKFSPLWSIEIIPEDAKTKLNRFLFDGIDMDEFENLKVLICGKDISKTDEGKEILKIYETQYETCFRLYKFI